MTTIPRARRYRTRREAPLIAAPRSAQDEAQAPAFAGPEVVPASDTLAPTPQEPVLREGLPQGGLPHEGLPHEGLPHGSAMPQGQPAGGAPLRDRPGASDPGAGEGLFEVREDGFEPFGLGPATNPATPGATLGPDPTSPLADPAEIASEAEIAGVRAEGLTGRQLRMARRVAQKHGIEATSDFDAVRQLRRQGIDPFDRTLANMIGAAPDGPAPAADMRAGDMRAGDPLAGGGLEAGTGGRGAAGNAVTRALARIDGPGADTRVSLPRTAPPPPTIAPGVAPGVAPALSPAPDLGSGEYRASEIIRIQRDIASRRRRKLALLMTRLTFFVFLPTLMAGYYFFAMATPLFATRSEFVIQQADSAGPSGLGSLFSGTQLATSQDSITVQSYLQSRDALLRLDSDLAYKAHFGADRIDPLQRLPAGATNEEAYKLFRRNVKIGYDPSEGIIKMEVVAADPEASVKFSQALISYAEDQVDQLTQRLREDQMQGARESYTDAEAKVLGAQQKVLELQEQLGVLDPVTESQSVMTQIGTFETQLQLKRLALRQLLDNARPNAARVDGAKGDIARLEALIADLRSGLTKGTGETTSLASVTGKLRIAEADLETRQLMLSQAAQQLETARIEANKQVRYLSMGVHPVAPDQATYPRSFENTVLAFLIFSGIYLMLSLTASILREQVTS